MIAKTWLAVAFIFSVSLGVRAQNFMVPAIGLKSHQTMEVLRVELQPQHVVVHLSIENMREGGTFCADRNIFMIYPDGRRVKIEKASGIPQCPDVHKFKKQGEILAFSLMFPALETGTGWFDIIEECSDNCFTLYGILLNQSFTSGIDEALSYAEKGFTDSAIGLYQKLIAEAGPAESGITGSLYSDLISLMVSKGYKAMAADWYRKLAASDVPRKELYLQNLNFRGIKF